MEIKQIPVEQITPSPMNPRKTFDEVAIDELAANIEKQGLLQPVTVRLVNDTYEIVCGERRFRAVMKLKAAEDKENDNRIKAHRKKLNNFQTVSCIVREMNDDEAFDAMITENLQRKDVDPIEEAFAFSQLVEKGATIEEIALRFGKSTRFVFDRTKLNALIPELKELVRSDEMPIAGAMLLSKLDEEKQKEFLENNGEQKITTDKVRSFIQRAFLKLDNSVWSDDDWEDEHFCLCANCKFNTANHGCLFYEMKGSDEELKLKLQLLELDKNAELDAAEKNGIPKAQIVKKYNHLEQELRQEHAAACASILMEQYSAEQAIRDVKHNEELATLKAQYAEKLKLAESEEEKMLLTEQYENDKARITEEYARATAEASIAAIEKQLAVEGLSVAEREKLNNALANAKIDLANITADAEIEAMKRTEAADNKLRDKRIANAKKYLQIASDVIGAITELASTMFDAEIEKLEEKQEANDEAYERDVERIDTLIEQGVISEEEGEARKREAKQKTEQKNEELEKKKNELAYKQAIWNKASQLAQTGIATARGIMEAYAQAGPFAGAVMAAIVGALGAIQAATIIATPIPKYARGTDKEGHKGGLAIVGDGGKQEVVVFGGQAWITPDTDTIVDLPKGAMVYPDANDFDFATLTPKNDNNPNVVVNNDYGTLEKNVGKTNELLKKNIGMQYRMTTKRTFTTYKVA